MAPKNQRWWLTTDQVEQDIASDAEALFAMVSDLPRIGEWSPECEGVDWEGDVVTPVEGSTFVGHNAVGPGRRIRYSRHGRVLVAERGFDLQPQGRLIFGQTRKGNAVEAREGERTVG